MLSCCFCNKASASLTILGSTPISLATDNILSCKALSSSIIPIALSIFSVLSSLTSLSASALTKESKSFKSISPALAALTKEDTSVLSMKSFFLRLSLVSSVKAALSSAFLWSDSCLLGLVTYSIYFLAKCFLPLANLLISSSCFITLSFSSLLSIASSMNLSSPFMPSIKSLLAPLLKDSASTSSDMLLAALSSLSTLL